MEGEKEENLTRENGNKRKTSQNQEEPGKKEKREMRRDSFLQSLVEGVVDISVHVLI